MIAPFIWPELDSWLRKALIEDIGSGDVTTESIAPPGAAARMIWTAKSGLVVCGLFAAERVFRLLDPEAARTASFEEGAEAAPGDAILRLAGSTRALLSGERVALNIVQRLAGIATLTRHYVKAVAGTRARIAATRKTTPHFRRLEKYAVAVGGGIPHRFGLDDGVLIKDNHIAVAGGVAEAVKRARAGAHHLLRIEVEVTTLAEVEEALAAKVDLLLLDNMTVAEIERAVKLVAGRAELEASGGMTLGRVAEVARTGVEFISVGALTHSAPAADVSARIEPS